MSPRIVTALADHVLEARARGLVSRIAHALPDHGRVLDIGSGTGHNAACMRATRSLEVVEADVASLRPCGHEAPVLFDGEHLPFADDTFDVATSFFVLHYAERPASLLHDALRVAPRLVLVQSTHGHRARWPAWTDRLPLATRDALLGRFALLASNLAGYTHAPWAALAPRRFFSRDHLLAVVREAGAEIVGHEPGPSTTLGLRRELLVLGRRS